MWRIALLSFVSQAPIFRRTCVSGICTYIVFHFVKRKQITLISTKPTQNSKKSHVEKDRKKTIIQLFVVNVKENLRYRQTDGGTANNTKDGHANKTPPYQKRFQFAQIDILLLHITFAKYDYYSKENYVEVDVDDDDEIKGKTFLYNCNFMRFFIVFDLRALTHYTHCGVRHVQKCEEK